MMKFILNFLIFGFIFYLISVYFPDAFKTLVSWAEQAWNFVLNTFHSVFSRGETPTPKP